MHNFSNLGIRLYTTSLIYCSTLIFLILSLYHNNCQKLSFAKTQCHLEESHIKTVNSLQLVVCMLSNTYYWVFLKI